MSFRAGIQRHPRVSVGVAVLLLGLVGLVIASNVSAPTRPGEASLYFTTDDGRTWFRASAKNVPPFEHDGKAACQVFLWTGDGGKTLVVSHLFRYTPAGRQRILEQQKNGSSVAGDVITAMTESEVKRPGQPESAWVRISDPRSRAIVSPPRDAGGKQLAPVIP